MEKIIGNSFLDNYFDETTMSMHVKEWRPLYTKVGTPAGWKPIVDEDLIMTKEKVQKLIELIYQEVEARDDGFLEIDRSLSKVIQLGPYRIVIVYPPLSDKTELTIVKPIVKLSMSDYWLDKSVIDLFRNVSKGILISGGPGSGKTTFAQALVELYHKDNHIIKTIESPRDLMVDDDVVQYSFTYGSHDEVRDILLLSRPDYTVYDEVRNKSDFELYTDLRLTGVWLIWIIHATRPVDSIQRFLSSIDMWVIPQVIDTVLFVDKGKISEILQLSLKVKVPAGMNSEDLARPVIVVNSFLSKKAVFEIYSFGEQIVVMPLDKSTVSNKSSKLTEYAQRSIDEKFAKLLPCDFIAKVISTDNINLYIPVKFKPMIIGKAGSKIEKIEKSIGMRINVKTLEELPILDTNIQNPVMSKKWIMSIQFPQEFANTKVVLLANDELYYFRANPDGKVIVKNKQEVKSLEKKGFLVIDLAHA